MASERDRVMGLLDVKGYDPAMIEDPVHCGDKQVPEVPRAAEEPGEICPRREYTCNDVIGVGGGRGKGYDGFV